MYVTRSKTKTNNHLTPKCFISFQWVEDTPVNELPGREEGYLPASIMEWSFTKSIFHIHITVMFCNQFLHQLEMAFSTREQDINNNQTVISPSVTQLTMPPIQVCYCSRNCSKKQLLHSLCNNLCFSLIPWTHEILNNWWLWVPHQSDSLLFSYNHSLSSCYHRVCVCVIPFRSLLNR